METFAVPIILGVIGAFVVYGIVAAARRKDSFWEDKREIRRKATRR